MQTDLAHWMKFRPFNLWLVGMVGREGPLVEQSSSAAVSPNWWGRAGVKDGSERTLKPNRKGQLYFSVMELVQ